MGTSLICSEGSTCIHLLLLFSWPLLFLQLQRQILRQILISIDQDLVVMDMEATPHCPCLASDMPITLSEKWSINPPQHLILTLHLVISLTKESLLIKEQHIFQS